MDRQKTRLRLAIGVGSLLAVLLAGFAYTSAFPRVPPLARSRSAYADGNFELASDLARRHLANAPHDVPARQILARSLARLGRDDEAIASFQGVQGDSLASEDLCLIGQALLRKGSPLLGAAALDGASKLDPRNREVPAALAALAARQQAEEARKADLLSAVPDGKALAVLVSGLLAGEPSATTPGTFRPWLDRVLERDRPTLAAVNSSARARRLLARVLLEDGRPAEAARLLAELSPSEAIEPESQWLLSRARLADGDAGAAHRALLAASGFGKARPMGREPSPYAGALACAACHREIYRSQQSGRHAATLVRRPSSGSVPLPPGPVPDPKAPQVIHEFERNGTAIKARARVGAEVFEAVVSYAIGSAHHGQTFLARDAAGARRSLRISYYTGGDHWGLTGGDEPYPNETNRFLGVPLTDESYRECVDCHSTRFRGDDAPAGPEAADHGIGCEKCHGPGADHLKAIQAGFGEPSIGRPKLASPAERLALCARCHSADGTIPPSDPKFIRFQATTLPYSRCVTEGQGKLDCVACHDPHQNAETSQAYYEARCLACHPGDKADAPGALMRLDPVRATTCSVNPRADCLGCHMPKVKDVLPFTSFTDHHIRVHREGPPRPKG